MGKHIQDKVIFENGVELRNRVVMAPMTISACEPGGYVSQADIDYYKQRAKGVGMIVTGCAYIDPLGQAFENSFSVAEDDKIEGLSRLAKAIQEEGSLAILQIYHGGRMVFPDVIGGKQPVAPSAVNAIRSFTVTPRALTAPEVNEMMDLFLRAIERAMEAGFDGVELHGANTYLLQQFYSPHSNIRRDKWGGTPNNRMRFSKTLVKKAKQLIKEKATKPFLLGYRFSPEEIENPGITLFDTLQLIEQLIRNGIDYLHTSVSNVWRSSLRETNQTEPIMHKIVEKIDNRVPFIAVGNIRTGEDAQKVLDANIPLFALGKPLLLDPEWTQKVAQGRENEIITVYKDELQNILKLPTTFVEELRDYLEGKY
ncbi:NADH-dependent flavin oxidoreductase [Granulicatella sp. zg-ZJ]|uniref:NADH-dependent flavin oxidoreductase n=1 Tax=unclassified Granulicatella TaxID=2630493 RepID=UPI0013C09875|nr:MULTISPECIES: NADH-dependent flavin oxidoreductase [unclassified Granulicatella]MBS4749692.1 NADH-dependent flavin oxidoreductase [Carnobacteriaceae bacterium zg-ZUI78]NEW61821.1 NADH-dependent flavin oxidoreductase [Granulicatella sp. zg-ZJ]NEW65895.1 NADH-dependent flavin oxidoreductase [Granulicatella sp. zg-84]QMI85124.1 NADH-dependent flavin oxidoreductase [Carnobacteriaceae bacterium zg-84]